MGQIKVLALDKTGTLTTGRFELQHLEIVQSENNDILNRDRILSLLLTLEGRASHPMSAALCSSAIAEGAKEIDDGEVVDFDTIKGEGICGTVDGRMLEVGNSRLLNRVAPSQISSELAATTRNWEEGEGGTVGYMCMDGQLVSVFSVSDAPRPEAKAAVELIHKLGITTIMLTGDNEGSALAVQRATGVRVAHASLLPEDKTAHLKKLRSDPQYKDDSCCAGGAKSKEDAWIGMVGDGVNDAPALALATVGIAMGATGTVAAMETADVTLMDTDLRKLAKAIRLGRQTTSKIKQNVIFSILTKIIVFGIALAGYPFLWLAILTDVGAMIAVTINSSTLLGRKKKTTQMDEHGDKSSPVCQNETNKEIVADCADGSCGGSESVKLFAQHDHGHGHGQVEISHAHGHGHGSNHEAPSIAKKECSKGCCSSKTEDIVVDKEECSKGCCSSKTEDIVVDKKECSKGCCSSKTEESDMH